jgi:hypothetical protein
MSDTQHLLQHQAEWQKNRGAYSWADKIHMVEAIQETLRQLKKSGDKLRNSQITDSTQPRNSK